MRYFFLNCFLGEILPGRVTGIMGASGSGKTTLAFALLGRSKRYCTEATEGTVYLNGLPRNLEAFLDRVGFVPQDDVLYPDLTVEESLEFSANWRLPRDLSYEEKKQVIENVLHTLDLWKIRHRRVGSVTNRGISGGERKRTSIGIELVSRPAVLVMDEPTSGLDSAGTFRLMKMLRSVAARGVSVVTVIHQPSARVYSLLDDLILMQEGEPVFTGQRNAVLPFLASAGYVKPHDTPEAEFILDVVARLENASGSPSFVDLNESCTLESLPQMWRYYAQNVKQQWKQIELKMRSERRDEEILRCVSHLMNSHSNLEQSNETCHELSQGEITRFNAKAEEPGILERFLLSIGVVQCKEGDVRMLCTMLDSRRYAFPAYQQHLKPGLKRQVHEWYWQMMGMKWRRGLVNDVLVIASLALTVSFVRSFNCSWNRRAVSNLFLSLSIGLLGMVGAVFHDDIAPVQRAASAGMLLGAHEFAVLAESITWGWCVCHIYTIFYFIGLYARTNIWIAEFPQGSHLNWVRVQKYYEFAHLLHLNYLASGGLGNAICVFAGHDASTSYVAAVALLIGCHVFAFFTPNRNQVRQATLFGVLNVGPIVEKMCQVSYARYFLEAMFLWDPSPNDKNGRNYVLRYFGYADSNKTFCATSLFSLWTLAQAVRFVIFGFRNSNDFHSLYDTPLFLIFIFKVLSCHVVALLIMTVIQEWYFPWVAAWQERAKGQLDEYVDTVN